MTVNTSVPRTLDQWLKQLERVRLPATTQSRDLVLHTVLDNRRSLRDIAERLQDCPAAALAVMREANRSTSSLGEPAATLETALNRIGLKNTEELLRRLPVLEESAIPQPLRQLQLISQHAEQQASGLFGARLARLWQEINSGALLLLAPLWPLAASQPIVLQEWTHRVLCEGEPGLAVERELLGVPLLQLCLQLAEQWRLPSWIIHCYQLLLNDRRLLVKALHIARDNEHPLHQQQILDGDEPLRRWLTRPENSILLANGLALSAHIAWEGQHSVRWQRLSGLYLHTALGELQGQIHQQAVSSARRHAHAGLWHPAEALLWPWSERRWKPLNKAAAAAAPVTPAGVLAWRQACSELLKDPTPFANVLQLTQCARDALQHSGMQRVLLLLTDRQHTRLQAQQSHGLPAEAGKLVLDPQQSQVLRRLLSQPGQLRLSPDNMAQFSALLPGSLKSLFIGQHLILRSIANQGHVAMLLVVDQHGAPFNETQLQAFGKTVQCIERALGSFARRGR